MARPPHATWYVHRVSSLPALQALTCRLGAPSHLCDERAFSYQGCFRLVGQSCYLSSIVMNSIYRRHGGLRSSSWALWAWDRPYAGRGSIRSIPHGSVSRAIRQGKGSRRSCTSDHLARVSAWGWMPRRSRRNRREKGAKLTRNRAKLCETVRNSRCDARETSRNARETPRNVCETCAKRARNHAKHARNLCETLRNLVKRAVKPRKGPASHRGFLTPKDEKE